MNKLYTNFIVDCFSQFIMKFIPPRCAHGVEFEKPLAKLSWYESFGMSIRPPKYSAKFLSTLEHFCGPSSYIFDTQAVRPDYVDSFPFNIIMWGTEYGIL